MTKSNACILFDTTNTKKCSITFSVATFIVHTIIPIPPIIHLKNTWFWIWFVITIFLTKLPFNEFQILTLNYGEMSKCWIWISKAILNLSSNAIVWYHLHSYQELGISFTVYTKPFVLERSWNYFKDHIIT